MRTRIATRKPALQNLYDALPADIRLLRRGYQAICCLMAAAKRPAKNADPARLGW